MTALQFSLTRFAALSLLLSSLGACTTYVPGSGPTRAQLEERTQADGTIQLVELNDTVARGLLQGAKPAAFAQSFEVSSSSNISIGPGDVLEVSIWEAPPGTLFAVASGDVRSPSSSRVTSLPEQMVSDQGTISVPFVGAIKAAGRSLPAIEAEIAERLKGKANQPQVMVRLVQNASANVTVIGEVTSSKRVPLTPKGERLLDALAAAGGTRHPVNKVTLQLTRGQQVLSMPMESVVRDPRQNIPLVPGDVITAYYQPLSFTSLGATGRNAEIEFEATGITLAQAIARAGGLEDARADARAVFLFRFESLPSANTWATKPLTTTPDGTVPVVYRLNLKDPASFFAAQGFAMQNKDVLYISNAPQAELQKFLNLITSVVFPILGVYNLTR